MPRGLAVAAAILCSLGLTGFRQAGEGYTIDFPAGWTQDFSADPALTSYVAPGGGTNCNAQSVRLPALDAMTQEQINAEQATPYNAAAWANFVGVDTAFIQVVETESRNRGDYYFQVATLTIMPDAMGNASAITTRIGAIVLVGRVVTAGCYADPKVYPEFRGQFDQTIGSLRPR